MTSDRFPWVFGGYWCIDPLARGDNLDHEFLNKIEAHLQKVVRDLKGIVFEIAWIDMDYLKDVIAQGESFRADDMPKLLDNVRALERLLLFQNRDALPVLVETNDHPFPYVQPPLEPPFDYEKQMILMVRKHKDILLQDIELDELLTFIYDHVYHDAFDPKIGKIHEKGFEAHLADITSRVRNASKAGWHIHSLTPLRGFAALCGRLKAQGYNIRP